MKLYKEALNYIIRNRLRLEEELPDIMKQSAAGLVGPSALSRHRDMIKLCQGAEQEILARLGNPC